MKQLLTKIVSQKMFWTPCIFASCCSIEPHLHLMMFAYKVDLNSFKPSLLVELKLHELIESE